MPLTLTITSYQRLAPGQETVKTLDRGSLSIGRAAKNDWVLQDPERILSSVHCVVQYQDGHYVLTDTSTNGTFFNDAEERIPRNQSVLLHDGDRFALGEYEITVSLTETDEDDLSQNGPATAIAPPPPPLVSPSSLNVKHSGLPSIGAATDPVGFSLRGMPDSVISVPNNLSFPDSRLSPDRLGLESPKARTLTAPAATEPPPDLGGPEGAIYEPPELSPGLLPASTSSRDTPFGGEIPEDHEVSSLRLGKLGESALPLGKIPLPSIEERSTECRESEWLIPEDWWKTPTEPNQRSSPTPSVPTSPPYVQEAPTERQAQRLWQAFLEGAGLPELRVTDPQAVEVMIQIGAIFRETIQGLMDILLARSDVKGEFRLDRTAIRPVENNPLKTPPGQPPLPIEHVMTLLLVGRSGAYMSPVEAVRESFQDIKAHQLAVISGIQAALMHLLARFDPKHLQTRLEQSMLDNLWPANRKAKYWDLFDAEYQTIAREAEDDFHELFGNAFARAYEECSLQQRR